MKPLLVGNTTILLFVVVLLNRILPCDSVGGELMKYTTPVFAPNATYRQDVCGRYDAVRFGQVELRRALDGLELRPAMAIGEFFNYDYETGIDRTDPGLMGTLMDEIAARAGFTWRDSFGIQVPPESLNVTWTEMLLWAVDTYDVAINWWDLSVERMERGVAYIEPWFDGSVVLIDKEDPPIVSDQIDFWNWTSPFEPSVWALIVLTIVMSALVFQFLEYLSGDRDARPLWQWFEDNLYLSLLNFSQNYEYAPNSMATRIFGVSMGMWALVITATYTANLASLFVEQGLEAPVVESIDQAVAWEIPICTYGNTNADFIIKGKWPNAKRVPHVSELEAYEALNRGECGLVAGYLDNWKGYKEDYRYNPDCDLDWVGRVVEVIKSGFAVKADAGHLCTSLIRDVLNLYMTEIIRDGVLDQAWDKHRAKTNYGNQCNVIETGDTERRQLRSSVMSSHPPALASGSSGRRRRKLKGGNAAATAGGAGGEAVALTMKHMAGTFVLHFLAMVLAVFVALVSKYLRKRRKRLAEVKGKELEERQEVRIRTHGPIIGIPPPLNTYVSQSRLPASSPEDEERDAEIIINKELQGADAVATPVMETPNTRRIMAYYGHNAGSLRHLNQSASSRQFNQGAGVENAQQRLSIIDNTEGFQRVQSDTRQTNQTVAKLQHDVDNLTQQLSMVVGLLQEMRQGGQNRCNVAPSPPATQGIMPGVLADTENQT